MSNSPQTILLAPLLDLAAVRSLTAQLLNTAADAEVVLDARNVTHFGSLCSQAILACKKRAANHSGSCEIRNLSLVAYAQIEAMGLSNPLLVER